MTTRPLRSRRIAPPGAQSGFTIIEVIVAALILAIVAAGSAVGFVGAIGDSGIQRNRSVAEGLAQQNEAQLHGWTVSQLANLNQATTKTVGNATYTIAETASFVSDSSASPSCSNPSANYLETSSTVTWHGMPSNLNGVTVTGLLTPTAGQISSNAGVLAVQVQNAAGTGYAGMPVSVTQTSPSGATGSASGVTASNGCALFADLPVGYYTVSVSPSSGAYVDAANNQTVSAASPDQQTNVQVASGTSASSPKPFVLVVPGFATFAFATQYPVAQGVSPSPAPPSAAPGVMLASGSLATPAYIACSAQDTAGCPATTNPDVNWQSTAWSTGFPASPLAPYTYSAYAGICSGDDPSQSTFGGVDQTTSVSSGQTAGLVTITEPAMVVRLYSGSGQAGVLGASALSSTAGGDMALPNGSELVVTDTGCGEHFVGGPGVGVPANDSYLPVNANATTGGGSNDVGVLTYPGMPDGQYTVCYQNGGKYAQVSVTNKQSGEVVDLYNASSSLSTGSCSVT